LPPVRAAARQRLVVILGLLQPGRHLHGARAGSVGGDCGGGMRGTAPAYATL
jgi:hypothetical protein